MSDGKSSCVKVGAEYYVRFDGMIPVTSPDRRQATELKEHPAVAIVARLAKIGIEAEVV